MSLKSLNDVDALLDRFLGDNGKDAEAKTQSSTHTSTPRQHGGARAAFLGIGATMDMLKQSKEGEDSVPKADASNAEDRKLQKALFGKRPRDQTQDDVDSVPTIAAPKASTTAPTPKKVQQQSPAKHLLGKRIAVQETLDDSDSDSEDEHDIGSKAAIVTTNKSATPASLPLPAPVLADIAKLEAKKEHQRQKRREKRARRKQKQQAEQTTEGANEASKGQENDTSDSESDDEAKASPVAQTSQSVQATPESKTSEATPATSKDTSDRNDTNTSRPSKSSNKSNVRNPTQLTTKNVDSKHSEVAGSTESKSMPLSPDFFSGKKSSYKPPIGFDGSATATDAGKPLVRGKHGSRPLPDHLVPAGPGKIVDTNTGKKLRLTSDGRIKTKKRSKQKNIRKDRRSDELKPQGEKRRELTTETKLRLTQSWGDQ